MKRQLNPAAQFAAITMLLVASAANADKIDIAGGNYQNSNGGEFKITTLTGPSIPGITGLAHDLSATTFQTFCIEHQENISLGGDYYFQVATSAELGGGLAGGATGTPSRDPLRYATQWLYVQFRNDTLAGYDDNNNSPVAANRRVNDARQLQLAFWFLENEIRANATGAALTDFYAYAGGSNTADQTANTTQAEVWVAAALAAEANPVHSASVAANVGVLRLWINANNTGYAQDQLTMVGPASALTQVVPLPSIAMAGSLCFGLLGFAMRKSRLDRAA